MRIQELFLKPVDRFIEGVIHADDERYLDTELNEYVVTQDVAKGLGIFTDRYLSETSSNGVWISGFFGSGKSHLLKILSLCLDSNSHSKGLRPAEILGSKIKDEIVRADFAKAAAIPARSVLFNIDQKFDGIGGDHSAPILEVFVKVLNELQGYFGKQGYIAKFERDLDLRGQFQPFKATYLRVNGTTWEADREALSTARAAEFGKAYAEHFGVTESEAFLQMQRTREDYRVSIESFAEMVKDYIARQPAGFRLNFFVDEVGQFVGQNSKLMLNLQTVAETLGTVCNGKAWIFVTSQADLEGVLGAFKGMEAQDITKIMGRFKTQLTLASADVREVIQERLLAKKEDEPEVLTVIYDAEKENLQTLYRFGDNSVNLKGWRGSDEFCKQYPFHPYQFDLFQRSIQQLSKHGAFTGKYLSVGERSMLAVFQEVAKAIRLEDVGRLATFDLMYDGISASIRGDMQTAIKMAERQLGDGGVQIRILKALFLLKWVREFKATARNVAILLIDRPEIDIRAHEKEVTDALTFLESQSYLQRNGELFEFLTDTEKDVEIEIKNTEIDESQVSDLLGKVLFADVLRDPKIRFEGNLQDYTYARKLDEETIGREADIAVNIITTEHFNHDDVTTLAMHNVGKAELLAVLPTDTRLIEYARLYLKTQKYVQQNTGSGDETRRAILDQRSQQNSTRRTDMHNIATDLLGKAPLFINGARLDSVGEGDPRNRFAKACQELINFAYPSLRMLKGTYDEGTLSDALLKPNDSLFGPNQTPSESEQEILTYVMRNQNSGERTTIEEIIRNFGRRPYGWYPMAVLTLVARLFRMGKVELRTTELLDADRALAHLKNARQHGGVRVRLQEQFEATKVNALKTFHQEFFDRSNQGTDARSVGEATAEMFRQEAKELELLLDQAARYPFLVQLRPVTERIGKLSEKDYGFLLNQLPEYCDELLAAKEDLISPIKAFMHGTQRGVYNDSIAFLKEEEANFVEFPAEEVQPLRNLAASQSPFKGNVLPTAKAAVAKLRGLLTDLLKAERSKAIAILDEQEARLRNVQDFVDLDESQQQQVLAPSVAARMSVESARFVTGNLCTLPFVRTDCASVVEEAVSISQSEWNERETSLDFKDSPFLRPCLKGATLEATWRNWDAQCTVAIRRMQELETENNRLFIDAYGLLGELSPEVSEGQITLARADRRRDMVAFLSYIVGCVMGRYSLDKPGLILSNAGESISSYFRKVGGPSAQLTFVPDEDGVIPVLDGEWFGNDIVVRTREFLRATFGEATLRENVRFIEESLGKDLRRYFLGDFYKDHLQTYKKRPIYWMAQSPRKSFSVLVYLHRYTRDTMNIVLNRYLREFEAKLRNRIDHLVRVPGDPNASAREKTVARKESDKLLKVLHDCEEWERHTVLPLAQARIALDLDDGVKANYSKLGEALAPIPGLAAVEE